MAVSIRINAEMIRRLTSQPENDSNIYDELDGIVAMETCNIIMAKAPKRIPVSFNNMSPSEQPVPSNRTILHRIGILNDKPDQKSPIFMQNDYEDEPVSDEFGAELWTFSSRMKDGIVYNHHFLVNVKTDGPAAKMEIYAYDEIVLLNTMFVPYLTHTDVRNLFHKVKIDGKTRFKLIIRRVVNNKSKKQWEWIDTSAILAPDVFQERDNYPIVEEPKFDKLPGDIYETRTIHFYKMPGTQYYLDVKNDSVVADVMTNTDADKTKRICKILRYSMRSDGMLHFTAALCTTPKMRYIAVGDGNQIKLDENPLWFEVSCIGNKIKFKINDTFLAFNSEALKIEAVHSEYLFDEIPANVGFDHPDRSEYLFDEVPTDEGLDHSDRSKQGDAPPSLSRSMSLPLFRNNSSHLLSLDWISTCISIPLSQKFPTVIVPTNDDTGVKRQSCYRYTPSCSSDYISDSSSQECENVESDKKRTNGFHSSADGIKDNTDSAQWFTDIEMDCPVTEEGYTRGSEILHTHAAPVIVF